MRSGLDRAVTWRTFWRLALAVALGGTLAELLARALWFFVILERLP